MTGDGTSTASRDGAQTLPGDEVQPDDVNSMTLTCVDRTLIPGDCITLDDDGSFDVIGCH